MPEASTAVTVSVCDWPALCTAEPVTTKRAAAPAVTVTVPDVPDLPLCEETEKTPLCSDLFHQTGDVEPLTSSNVVGRSHPAMCEY